MSGRATLSIVIPTLSAGEPLRECLESVARQSHQPVEIFVIDNSGTGTVRGLNPPQSVRVIENSANLGFGAAANQGIRASSGEFVLVLNDDAAPHPDAARHLIEAISQRYEIGSCAPQIRLAGTGRLDSAGMLLSPDGVGKQRGHGADPESFGQPGETLFPSGCAALYRRAMLDEIGLFEERYFLYCEDTDLGLRARWKAWECRYVPDAVVEHRYSESAGRASALKAYHVERNRAFTIIRNFPAALLWRAPWHTLVRFHWHWRLMRDGRGAAASYDGAESLHRIVLRAWIGALAQLPALWRERRRIQAGARLKPKQFERLLAGFRIGSRQVAEQ